MRETHSPLRLFTVSPRKHTCTGERAGEQAGVIRVVWHKARMLEIREQGAQLEISGKLTHQKLSAQRVARNKYTRNAGHHYYDCHPLQRVMGHVPPPSPGLTVAATGLPTPPLTEGQGLCRKLHFTAACLPGAFFIIPCFLLCTACSLSSSAFGSVWELFDLLFAKQANQCFSFC